MCVLVYVEISEYIIKLTIETLGKKLCILYIISMADCDDYYVKYSNVKYKFAY